MVYDIAKAEVEFIEKLEAIMAPKYTEDCIIVRHSKTDAPKLQVVQFKVAGIAKGETVLATLCGGNMGKVLAVTVAKQAMEMTMIDKLVSEV
jgi:tRNA G37 N-methylase TrmD